MHGWTMGLDRVTDQGHLWTAMPTPSEHERGEVSCQSLKSLDYASVDSQLSIEKVDWYMIMRR